MKCARNCYKRLFRYIIVCFASCDVRMCMYITRAAEAAVLAHTKGMASMLVGFSTMLDQVAAVYLVRTLCVW